MFEQAILTIEPSILWCHVRSTRSKYWLILCGGGQLNIKNNQIEKFVLFNQYVNNDVNYT